jgi:hypothetical protein
MQVKHAAIAGLSIGLLSGTAICIVIGTTFSDALFRIFILSIGGAWMGILLAWLNDLLTPETRQDMSHGHRGRRS